MPDWAPDGKGLTGREGLAAAGICLLALGLRGLYIYQSASSPFFDFPLVDAKTYADAARRMALEGKWAGEEAPFWQPPLYPYLLGLLFWIFGPGFYVPRLVQAVLGALNCALIFLLGRRVFSPGVGLAAACMAAFYGPFIFYEGELLPVSLAVFLDLCLLLALLWASPRGWKALAVPGLLLGLSALCVANILLFLPCACAWLYWRDRGRAPAMRVGRLAVFAGSACLAIAPVAVRNMVVGGDRVLISSNAGINFYIGNNPDFDRTVHIEPGPEWQALANRPLVEAGLTKPSQQSHYFFAQAWNFMRDSPWAYIRLQLYKGWLFWRGDEIGRNQDLYYARHYSSVLSLLLWKKLIAFPFGALAPLALVGLYWAFRQRQYGRAEPALLLLFLVSYALSVVLFFVAARYRLPAVPALLLFGAWGAAALWRLARRRELALAALLPILVVGVNFRVGEMDMKGGAQTWHRLGYVFEEKGLYANARAAYLRALERDPDIQEARFNLGSLYARQGRYDRALETYGEFVARFPERPEGRYALGNVLLKKRAFAEAIEQYEYLLREGAGAVDPADIQGRLAYAYVQADRPERAAQAYEALLESRPDSLLVRYQLGRLYQARGLSEEARRQYEQVLARDPTHAQARYQLAFVLFVEGRPEEAKAHLLQLIARNPSDVEARWLLAKQYVVEHRGEEALEEAQAILRIDPAHVQANRLAGHLYVIRGDTLAGVELLEQFKKHYVEERQEEILGTLMERWKVQLGDLLGD